MPKKILFLDPDQNFRSLVKPELEAWGALVTVADNASEACVILEHESFALLIVSETLPAPDSAGSDFINRLTPVISTPIAFLSSGSSAPETMALLLKNQQVVLILQKPLQPVVFSEQIANYLELTYTLPGRQDKSKLPEMLSLLRAAYINEIPNHLAEITQAISRAQSIRSKKHNHFLDEALRKIHRLNGTCGSYGFVDLSKVLASLEKTLIALQETAKDSLWHELTMQLNAAQTIATKDREDSKSRATVSQTTRGRP